MASSPDDPAAAAIWLEAVGSTRLGCGEAAPPSRSTITSSVSGDGVSQVVLTCASPASSSAAVAEVLLAEFAQRRPGAALARGVHVEVQQSSSSKGGGGGGDPSSGGGGPSGGLLQITFKSAEPGAASCLERAARLFEAYLHYHVKTTKSYLHTRMRQRLAGLRQELKSCALSSFAPAKA